MVAYLHLEKVKIVARIVKRALLVGETIPGEKFSTVVGVGWPKHVEASMTLGTEKPAWRST